MFISQNAHIGFRANDAALPDATHNLDFNNRATYWLAQQQLTHAVDSLNSYISYAVVDLIRGGEPQVLSHKKAQALQTRFCESDRRGGRPNLKDYEAREMLELLGINLAELTWLVIETRHCAIHHNGRDKDGKVWSMLTSLSSSQMPSSIPLQVDKDGVILLSKATGEWAFDHVLILIQEIDHVLVTKFGLAACEYAFPTIIRKFAPQKHEPDNGPFYSPNAAGDDLKIEKPLLDPPPSVPDVVCSASSGFKLADVLVRWLTDYAVRYAQAYKIRVVSQSRSVNFGAGLPLPEHYSQVIFSADGREVRSSLCIRGQVSPAGVSVYIQTERTPLRVFSHLECGVEAINHLEQCIEGAYQNITSGV